MLLIIIIILGVSLLLYTLLGGADFGAGIIEIFSGTRGEKTVSKAMAPVWEANHVWLILAIVIIFTGFPTVYATISLYLHIPLMIVLLGIVLRGASFIFRYYDESEDKAHKYFTVFFKISSLVTPVFLGIIIGAMTGGKININQETGFFERFIFPWLNIFCITLGLFSASLFAYIAAIFLVGETSNPAERKRYARLAKIFLITTFSLGLCVFGAAKWEDLHLWKDFISSPLSMITFGIAVLLIPAIFFLFDHPNILYLRAVIGFQVTLILLGWFAIHYPVLVYEKNGNHLDFFTTRAPDATLYQLVIALLVGLVLIIPSFYFLFKVFKKTKD